MGPVRAAKSKVRTGCRTCKQRRVKCGEEKPECLRCTKSGRECGGYEIIAPKTVAHGALPKVLLPGKPPSAQGSTDVTYLGSMPTTIPGADIDENNYFAFFVRYTAPTIGGAFASPFFERFVLQLSLREPMIRHAATALGALQRAQERHGKVTLDHEEAGFALRQYGKAINLTRRKLFAPDLGSQRLKLVACILFICYEIAQKRFRETAMHLENGLYMLVHVRHKGNLPSGWDTDEFSNADDAAALDREILRTFDRLDIQSTFVRSTRPKLPADPIMVARKTPRRFANLEQAREFLSVLTRSISTFRHDVRATPSPFTFEDEQALKTQQMQIRHQMRAWNSAFGSLKLPQVPLPPNQLPSADVAARAVLEAMALTGSILLETGVADGRECIFDDFVNDFKTLIELGQIAKDHPRFPNASMLPNGGASFRIHMGCIPTVYIVALKCRDPVVRRRALALLESFPFREGMWDAGLGAALCRHVMEVEEAGYDNLTCAQDLPEKARIHEAMFDMTDWDGGMPVYYKRRDFEGEYGKPGLWLNWSGRTHVPEMGFEEREPIWKCTERYHHIQSGTGRCLGCGRLAEEIPTRGEEMGWNSCQWDQMTRDGEFEEDYASSDHSPSAATERTYSPHSHSGPPGRGPPDMLLQPPRSQSCNLEYSQYSGDEYMGAVAEPADLRGLAAGSVPHSPNESSMSY